MVNQPVMETRNRKRMRPNPVAPWELRVYYEISDIPRATVTILAVGVKERDRVRIGGGGIRL
jgi:hypothetical protein